MRIQKQPLSPPVFTPSGDLLVGDGDALAVLDAALGFLTLNAKRQLVLLSTNKLALAESEYSNTASSTRRSTLRRPSACRTRRPACRSTP